MSERLIAFIKENYQDEKMDLFASFVTRCANMTIKCGFSSLITPQAIMFIKSFEKLRLKTLTNQLISSMMHLGFGAFGADFGTTAFVLRHTSIVDYNAQYVRLTEHRDAEDKQKQAIEVIRSLDNNYITSQSIHNFGRIIGTPIAYWVKDFSIFSYPTLNEKFVSGGRLKTHNNTLYVRYWWEVVDNTSRWQPFADGGDYRKWYGNHLECVDWCEDAQAFYAMHGGLCRLEFVNREGLTWGAVTSAGRNSYRIKPSGFLFSSASPTIYSNNKTETFGALAFLNTKVARYLSNIINPTVNQNVNDTLRLPYSGHNEKVSFIADDCIVQSKTDWDSFETSWDFQRHPLIRGCSTVEAAFRAWEAECSERFNQLKANEEELNRIFIDIYGLQDELTPEVEDKDVTVRKADLRREVRSLISYAVGCMFGRYSLDEPGLILAGQDFSEKFTYASVPVAGSGFAGSTPLYTVKGSCYLIKGEKSVVECSFAPDEDNIIPICDDEYFPDDIVGRFVEFIRVVYGAETLEANLKYIADALGGRGTPREVIRNYFLNDFYKDHCKIYQKRPIYWLFDSGKKNGFKCLIYLHRYKRDTIARIRTDYVHAQQGRYRTAIDDLERRSGTGSASDKVKVKKQLAKLNAQAEELHQYEEKIHHLADQMIRIDLDDGVKKNYAIFKDVLAKVK